MIEEVDETIHVNSIISPRVFYHSNAVFDTATEKLLDPVFLHGDNAKNQQSREQSCN